MENSLKHGYNAIDHSVASHSTIRCNGAVKAPPLGGANASQQSVIAQKVFSGRRPDTLGKYWDWANTHDRTERQR